MPHIVQLFGLRWCQKTHLWLWGTHFSQLYYCNSFCNPGGHLVEPCPFWLGVGKVEKLLLFFLFSIDSVRRAWEAVDLSVLPPCSCSDLAAPLGRAAPIFLLVKHSGCGTTLTAIASLQAGQCGSAGADLQTSVTQQFRTFLWWSGDSQFNL